MNNSLEDSRMANVYSHLHAQNAYTNLNNSLAMEDDQAVIVN